MLAGEFSAGQKIGYMRTSLQTERIVTDLLPKI
jgi:hypothetical protein